MADGTVYLDIDDEITSAAARIRAQSATKVALVVPHGSRLSTSRMNFRLLSREAVVNNRRLSIVAADPATRALAASAGLPAFATVAEYDAAVAGPKPTIPDPGETAEPAAAVATPTAEAVAPAAAPAVDAGTPGDTAEPVERERAPAETDHRGYVSDDTIVMAVPLDLAASEATVGPARRETSRETSRPANLPVARSRRRLEVRTPLLAAAGVAALAVLVAAVAGYLLLPAATVAVTPRQEAIGPISLVVRADPTATAVDVEAAVVPAVRLDLPVESSQAFDATGARVEEDAATGTVTFSNFNFLASNTVPAGSVVRTASGVAFSTNAAVSLPAAAFDPFAEPQVTPTRASVGVTAVEPGPEGNVGAGTIRRVPPGEDERFLQVTNGDPTGGGARREFPQVSQADVDAALATLQTSLQAGFDAAVAGGAGAPTGATVFPETAVLGPATPSVDPATIVGQEVATFELGLTASGTVIAVDASPVTQIADAQLRERVGVDHRLVEDSIEIEPGDATVSDGQVSFPVTARAARIALIDPAEIAPLIKGLTAEDAERALTQFGDVSIELWPDWVTTVTTVDSRITVEIVGQGDAGDEIEPSAEPGERASPGPDAS